MKLPLPIEIVKGRYPVVTQEWGDTSRVEYYRAHGLNITAHNGTDIVIGGPGDGGRNTYGTKLVCPADALRNATWFTSPLSTQGNGVKVQWQDEERGTIKMVVWHLSEVNRQEEYKKGDLLGYIGNSGLVDPPASVWNVFQGSHLHLGTWINNVECDPREIFDFSQWHVSETDTSMEKDLPPFVYFINKVREGIASLTG